MASLRNFLNKCHTIFYLKIEMSSSFWKKRATPEPRVGMRMEMRPELKVTWWGILFWRRS